VTYKKLTNKLSAYSIKHKFSILVTLSILRRIRYIGKALISSIKYSLVPTFKFRKIIMLYIIILWIVCGIIDYGFSFAYLQRKYPRLAKIQRNSDIAFCLLSALLGPCSRLVDIALGWTSCGWLLYVVDKDN
jgi:hypothetical protein